MRVGVLSAGILAAGVATAYSPATSSATGDSCAFTNVGAAPGVPAVTAAPKTALWREQYAEAVRAMAGLNSSPKAIATAEQDPHSTTESLATPLTPGEVQQLAARDAARGLAIHLLTTAQQTHSPLFAGAWLDPADQEHVDVAMIGDRCPNTGQISSLVAPGVSWSYVRARGDVPYIDLVGKNKLLEAHLAELQREGFHIASTRVDTVNDQYVVTVAASASADYRAILPGLLGGAGLTIHTGPPATSASDPRYNPSDPVVYGGEELIDQPEAWMCTSNISLTNNKGQFGVLTAGHCFLANDPVSQNSGSYTDAVYDPNKYIGGSVFQEVSQGAVISCDCESLGPLSASRETGTTLVNNDAHYPFQYYATSEGYYEVSPMMCLSGISEYYGYGQDICGYGTVSDTSIYTDSTKDSCHCSYTLNHAFTVNLAGSASVPGDSGGVIGEGPTLVGVLSSINSNSSVVNASKVEYVTSQHPGGGLRPVLPGH